MLRSLLRLCRQPAACQSRRGPEAVWWHRTCADLPGGCAHLSVVPRRVRPYRLCRIPSPPSASNSVGNSPPAVGKRFVNSKPLSVYTHPTLSFAFERSYHFPQKVGGGICALLLVCPQHPIPSSIRRSPCTGTASIPALQCSCAVPPLRRSVGAPRPLHLFATVSGLYFLPSSFFVATGQSFLTHHSARLSTQRVYPAFASVPTVPRDPQLSCAGACLGSASVPAGCAPGDGCAAVLTGTEAIPCFHHTVSSRSRCMTGSCCTSCLPLLRHIFLHIALWSSGIAHLVLYCS